MPEFDNLRILNAGYVQAKFYDKNSDCTETLWVQVDRVYRDVIEGTLYQEPIFMNAKKFDTVTLKFTQIVDLKPKAARGVKITAENLNTYYPVV